MISFQPKKMDEVFDVNRLQREASNPESSVWVSASAGSGKTKVLSDRITRLLLDGVAPQKILCLTFTKAAAAEMSIRLTQRLSKWATCDDKALDDELDKLQGHAPDKGQRDRARRLFARTLSCPGGMRIQTIHSFAQEILYRFPLEAGLAPHFTVLEEAGAEALKKEALSDFLQQVAEGKDSSAAQALKILVPAAGERQLALLLKEVGAQREKWKEIFDQEGGMEPLLSRLREKLDLDEDDSEENVIAQACREDAFNSAQLLYVGRLLIEKGSPKKTKPKGQKICFWLNQDEAGRKCGWDDYKSAFLKKDGTPRIDIVNKKLLDEHPEIEEIIQTESLRLTSLAERFDTLRLFKEGAALMTLGVGVMKAYAARKEMQAALDFDDLILHAKALLSRPDIAPWVLFKLDGGIDHILLDEAQDTNPTQWHIVKILTDEFFSGEGARPERERTLFVVGDEKQSIYSFLKADPQEFERMRVYFKEKIGVSGAALKETPLHVSFRSAPAVLRAVDAVFADDKVRQGVSQTPVQHRAFRDKAQGRVEVWELFPQEKTEDKKNKKESTAWLLPLAYEGALDPIVGLAQMLAVCIKGWIEDGQTIFDRDLGAERSIRPEDVMVLVQTRGAFVDHFVRALKNRNVPVSGVDRMRLTDQLAVMDLMALIQFTLLPQDNLNLACVLRGPLIGASEEDLMKLSIKRKGTLWESLRSHAKTEKHFAAWCAYLEALALQADRLEPLSFLIHILTQICPPNEQTGRRAIAARLGPEAEDPIDELLNLAENFKTQQGGSLQAFLQWLIATDAEIKRELEQADGRVRITTVHRSKGLESPIVILPDTMRVPRSTSLPKILWDSVSGLPFYVPSKPLNGFLKVLYDGARTAQLEEYRRLLYVALTRAADRLIVCGFEPKKKEAGNQNWHHLVTTGLAPHHQPEALGEGDDEGTLVLADYAAFSAKRAPDAAPPQHDKTTLPSWAKVPPLPEPPQPRPLVPSRPSEPEPPVVSPQDKRFVRGNLVHRLLQNLPELLLEKREEATRRFLSNPQHNLSLAQQEEIVREVLDLLAHKEFKPLFGSQSKAEVPIIGLSGARLISGQVDRLALVGDEVWIVDYKTNRPPPEDASSIPALYRRQMEAYRTVLTAIYPKKKIRCFLLWTYTLRLMEVEALKEP